MRYLFICAIRVVLTVAALSCVGCTQHDDPAVMAHNRGQLATSGVVVGVLPDGRRVVRYCLDMGTDLHDHWVYVVGDTVTVNHAEQHGKATQNHVEVVIGGVRYIAAPPEQEE